MNLGNVFILNVEEQFHRRFQMLKVVQLAFTVLDIELMTQMPLK
jgi:hypothetical protein